jgi:caffeoyl-CoA O-methyltransferase
MSNQPISDRSKDRRNNPKIDSQNNPLEILLNHLLKAKNLAEQESISAELKNCLIEAEHLASGLNYYGPKHSRAASKELEAIAKATQNQPWEQLYKEKKIKNRLKSEMRSSAFQAQLLKFLVQITRSTRVLEIGMFTGYVTLAIAEALPDRGSITACEHDPHLVEIAHNLLRDSVHYSKIKIMLGEGKETLTQLIREGEVYDFIFLDANKRSYLAYYQLILAGNLLDQEGILCVDNTLFKGEVFEYKSQESKSQESKSKIAEAIAEFNQVVANDERVEQILLSLGDGLSLIKLA